MIVADLIAKFSMDAKGFVSGIARINAVMLKNAAAFRKASLAVGTYTAAVAGAVYKTSQWITGVEAIERRMKAATLTIEANARAWNFVRETSSVLGLSLEELAYSYSGLAAAMQGTGMQAAEVERIFKAISQRAAILGMSSQRVRLTFLAIEQMGSKGVIAMEELRRQFGEQVPGAMGIFARALQISTAELSEWVKTGKLETADVFPLLADQMLKENLVSLPDLMTSTARSVAELQTSWFNLKKVMAEGVVKDTLVTVLSSTAAFLEGIQKLSSGLGSISKLFELFKTMVALQVLKPLGLSGLLTESPKQIEETFMTAEEIAKRIEDIRAKIFGKDDDSFEKWAESMANGFHSILSEFTSTIVAMATGAEYSFTKMVNNMLAKLLEFSTEMLVIMPIVESFKRSLQTSAVSQAQGLGTGSFGNTIAAGLSWLFNAPAPKAMASGGVIDEPVFGIGASGKSYLMGEAGSEAVVPLDKMGGGGANVNVNINAIDSKSFSDLLKRNPNAIVAPIVDALNKGDRGLSSSITNAIGG